MPFLRSRCLLFLSFASFVYCEAISLFGVLHTPFISRPARFFFSIFCWCVLFPFRFVSPSFRSFFPSFRVLLSFYCAHFNA
ncbi:hypothetical protein C8J57DRAFT_1288142, partial [Mycena rebaudengoi]